MVRIILGVITGFIVWSIVWVGGEETLNRLSPMWFGEYGLAAEKALRNGTPFVTDPAIAAIHLVRSFATSFIAGYMAALVAGESKRTIIALGIILVIVGIAVEYAFWSIAPVWYHVLFILFLFPMTFLGGRLRRPD